MHVPVPGQVRSSSLCSLRIRWRFTNSFLLCFSCCLLAHPAAGLPWAGYLGEGLGGRARELGGDFSSFILFTLFGGWAAAMGPGRLRLASCGVLNREHQSSSPGCFAARASTCQEIIQRCPSLAGAGTWGLLAPQLPQASAAPADGLAPFLPQFPLMEKQTWNCRILNLSFFFEFKERGAMVALRWALDNDASTYQ